MSNYKGKQASEEPSLCRFKSICILGGRVLGKDKEFLEVAKELGRTLAVKGINLVYGGGIRGLRGYVATYALGGSKILGINLKGPNYENFNDLTVGTEVKVPSIPERLGYMFFNAEAFIALPGDLEALFEISNIAYWSDLNIHNKPLILLNINGFYDGLLVFLKHAVKQGFISQATLHTIMPVSTVNQVFDQLQACASGSVLSMKQVDRPPLTSRKRHDPDTNLCL